ncbi:glutamate 5-kinase [Candidatus Marinamargulisbacteria bacterium SCGC AG-410-N11]|nr:glutamate 5-kinase [Candidatus Marinamargulisbacteria bacterium SCGC AG-410-N11]
METIVIKIGTNILTTPKGKLDLNNLRNLCNQIATLKKDYKIIVVSSGAITCGSEYMNIKANSIPEKQAAAAIGQILLMKEYSLFFNPFSYQIGQILVTKDGLHDPKRKNNILNTIKKLVAQNIIPIINENDSVSTEEIQFGDNDELSSEVAILVKASKFIILSDINGVYDKNPHKHKNAKLLTTIKDINNKILNNSEGPSSKTSKGGMKSKIIAAKKASDHKITTIIANGRKENILIDITNNNFIGTTILHNSTT